MGPLTVTDNGGPNIGRVHDEHKECQHSKESLNKKKYITKELSSSYITEKFTVGQPRFRWKQGMRRCSQLVLMTEAAVLSDECFQVFKWEI